LPPLPNGLGRQLPLHFAVSTKPEAFVLGGSFTGVLTHLFAAAALLS
jgi:hypothetical protein